MAALALLSGGLDSLVAATHAARHGGLALCLTLDYGQRAARKERESAASIAAFLNAEHRVIRLPFLKQAKVGALTDPDLKLPAAAPECLDDSESSRERARAVWVPNRNGLFIHVAACLAQTLGLDRIIVGFNSEEGAAFPDNRPEFLEACNRALSFTLDRPVKVESPTLRLDKAGIVAMGIDLGAPLHLVWSCYEKGPNHCFRCESCQRLKRALQAGGVWDSVAPRLGAE